MLKRVLSFYPQEVGSILSPFFGHYPHQRRCLRKMKVRKGWILFSWHVYISIYHMQTLCWGVYVQTRMRFLFLFDCSFQHGFSAELTGEKLSVSNKQMSDLSTFGMLQAFLWISNDTNLWILDFLTRLTFNKAPFYLHPLPTFVLPQTSSQPKLNSANAL